MKTVALSQTPLSQTSADFSFEIWRQIFRVIATNERKALDTGVPVVFSIEVNERDAEHQAALLKVDLICEPNVPAREMPSCPAPACEGAVTIAKTLAACPPVPDSDAERCSLAPLLNFPPPA